MLKIVNLINTLIQAIVIGYIPYYCLNKDKRVEEKSNDIKFITSIIAIFTMIIIISNTIGTTSIASISMTISCMIILACFYNKNYDKAIVAYIVTAFIMQMSSIILGNIQWSYIQNIIPIESVELSTIIFMYIPVMIIEGIMILSVDKIYKIYNLIASKKYGFTIAIIISISLDVILTISFIIHGNETVFLKNLFIIFLMVFLTILILYFINTKNKMDEISKLNQALQDKNNELKKVKHDYGSQISYINGLYIMEQYDRLGNILKGIINGNESVSDNIKILSSSDSIISVIVNAIDSKGINIIVDEDYDISNLNISEYDIQKIISNIVSNSVTVLGESGLIVIKTYKIFGNVYIAIKNNGAKIDDEIIDKIFEPGFTTKERGSENGFGLAIVKELVKVNQGELVVSSTDDFTEFKIIFKI